MPARPIPHPVVPHHNPLLRNASQTVPFADSPALPVSSGANNPALAQSKLDLLTNPIITTLTAYTVATLPAAATYGIGLAVVTDATLTMITGLGLAPVGGGANTVPCFSDGVGWKII